MSSTDALAYIIQNLRVRDLLELDESGHTSVQAEALFRAPGIDLTVFASPRSGKPAAALVFFPLTPRALTAGMLATNEWPDCARLFVREAHKTIKPRLISRGYKRAECRTMEGHDDAIRLLEHLGWKQEARLAHYGKTGRAFLQYAWEFGDHRVDQSAAVPQQRLREHEPRRALEHEGLRRVEERGGLRASRTQPAAAALC